MGKSLSLLQSGHNHRCPDWTYPCFPNSPFPIYPPYLLTGSCHFREWKWQKTKTFLTHSHIWGKAPTVIAWQLLSYFNVSSILGNCSSHLQYSSHSIVTLGEYEGDLLPFLLTQLIYARKGAAIPRMEVTQNKNIFWHTVTLWTMPQGWLCVQNIFYVTSIMGTCNSLLGEESWVSGKGTEGKEG